MRYYGGSMARLYEIARDLKEAKDLAAGGFGYETRKAAEKALASPEIDNFYRNQLKVIAVEIQATNP